MDVVGFRIGRYEILSRISAGGMGEIFHARATGAGAFEKRVALKLLLPHLAQEPEFVKMFLDEARIAAQMNHPNVLHIFDLGEANGRYYIAMALVEGVSLSQLLRAARQRNTQLPLPVWRAIAAGLCDALTHAHELRSITGEPLQIVHRDVTPGNLLLSRQGAVLLTDFGIARAANNLYRTRTGAATRGKYPYMAPEQLSSTRRVDLRADVYSAAVTLYEALTLVAPFRRATDAEVMDAVRAEPLPDASTLRFDVPPLLCAALAKGTAKTAEARFSSARELRAALIDGPLASADEVGEWVVRLCAEELTRVTSHSGADGPGTRTAAPKDAAPSTSSVTDRSARGSRSRRWALFAVASALLAAASVGALAVNLGEDGAAGSASASVASAAAAPQAQVPTPTPPAVAVPVTAQVAEAVPARAEKRDARRTPKPRIKDAADGPAPVKFGYLSADARPWAWVKEGDKVIDRTPISRYPLPVGTHVLVFRNDEVGKEIRRTVRIREGKVEFVRVDLNE